MSEIFYDANTNITQENIKKEIEIITTVFKEMSIRIFFHAGTLLSAIRDKNFIPYNNDYDFGMFREEITADMREKIIEKLVNNKFILRELRRQSYPVFKLYAPYTHCNTDFFIFEKRENDYYHGSWKGYHYFLKETLDTLDESEFMGLKILIPHNSELFLEYMYGKDWKTPKKMKKPDDYKNWTKELKNGI